jgi:hypothetical protein
MFALTGKVRGLHIVYYKRMHCVTRRKLLSCNVVTDRLCFMYVILYLMLIMVLCSLHRLYHYYDVYMYVHYVTYLS